MGALCGGPNKHSEAFNATNLKLTKDEHGHFESNKREIHEEYSVDGFETNMELFNKKWP